MNKRDREGWYNPNGTHTELACKMMGCQPVSLESRQATGLFVKSPKQMGKSSGRKKKNNA